MQAKARRRKRDWRTSDPWRARERVAMVIHGRARAGAAGQAIRGWEKSDAGRGDGSRGAPGVQCLSGCPGRRKPGEERLSAGGKTRR
jgi:hypothetical protein